MLASTSGHRWVLGVIATYFAVAAAVIYFGITISRLRGMEGWDLDA
tara:strand:- start:403 stop:540 length:138 start_codon:yes stop_codon:yes gene_type:complete